MYHHKVDDNDNSDQMVTEINSVLKIAGIHLPVATEIPLFAAIKELETVKFLASVSVRNSSFFPDSPSFYRTTRWCTKA